jgi:hypothetical protein
VDSGVVRLEHEHRAVFGDRLLDLPLAVQNRAENVVGPCGVADEPDNSPNPHPPSLFLLFLVPDKTVGIS